MIDFAHLEQYRENNRIKAKKARGGLLQKSPSQPHLHAVLAPLSRTKAPPASPEF